MHKYKALYISDAQSVFFCQVTVLLGLIYCYESFKYNTVIQLLSNIWPILYFFWQVQTFRIKFTGRKKTEMIKNKEFNTIKLNQQKKMLQ